VAQSRLQGLKLTVQEPSQGTVLTKPLDQEVRAPPFAVMHGAMHECRAGLHTPTLASQLACAAPPHLPPLQGRFAFTTTVGGEYQLCFATNSSRWFGQVRRGCQWRVRVHGGAEAQSPRHLRLGV